MREIREDKKMRKKEKDPLTISLVPALLCRASLKTNRGKNGRKQAKEEGQKNERQVSVPSICGGIRAELGPGCWRLRHPSGCATTRWCGTALPNTTTQNLFKPTGRHQRLGQNLRGKKGNSPYFLSFWVNGENNSFTAHFTLS